MQINQLTEIKHLWLIKTMDSSSTIELRAIAPNNPIVTKVFRANQYRDVEALQQAFEDEAIKLNQQGYNIYVVMNPIKANFAGNSASDDDIESRDLLLIDIDRATPTKQPSNQAELDAASALAKDISEYLKSLGWDNPIWMLSGNGYHLYYALNKLPNDIKHKELVSGVLKELADRFDNSIVKVDTCVFNASRITKVPGTIAYKGEATEDRPYRMARVLP